MKVLCKLKTELRYSPAIPLLGVCVFVCVQPTVYKQLVFSRKLIFIDCDSLH